MLRVDGLVRRYGERPVLRGVSFELGAGQTLAVLGSNGAGKTTLLRVLATLLRPHAGTVQVLGETLPDGGWKVRGRLGLLGHEPLLYRDLTARENLLLYARLHGVGSAARGAADARGAQRARIADVLAAVGLARRADEPLRTLSRGMVQRAAIARAVLHEPELLLLDEPLANLDPAARATVAPLIGRSSGRTRVLVSHDVEEGIADADVVLGLRGGEVALLAPARGVDPAQARKEVYA